MKTAHALTGDHELRTLQLINEELAARIAALGAEAARVPVLADELDEVRQHLDDKNRVQRELDREIVELRTIAAESERQLAGIRRTLAYRVGQAMVGATASWRGFFAFPWRLWQIWHGHRLKRKGPATRTSRPSGDRLRFVEETLRRLRAQGVGAAHRHVRSISKRLPQEKARALAELAIAVHAEDLTQGGKLGAEAAALNPAEPRLRTLIFDLYDRGAVRPAAAALARASPDLFKPVAYRQRAAMIRSDAAELTEPLKLPPRAAWGRPRTRHLAIVTPRSLPRHSDAVGHRAQSIALAAMAAGWRATIITEPGHQVPAEAEDRAVARVLEDGTSALRLPVGLAHPSAVRSYVAETATLIETQLVSIEADLVHILADGAVPLALSAGHAARAVGLDYVLDLGNVPAAGGAGRSGWESSERFAAQLSRLTTLTAQAKAVLFRSEAVATSLAPDLGIDWPWVVPDEVPRTVEPVDEIREQQVRRELGGLSEDRRLITMFGVVGGDAGALRVVEAMHAVRAAEPRACLAFLGSGRMGSSVRRIAAQRGLNDWVVVPDAFVRQRLPDYVGSSAVTVVPCRGEGPAGLAMPLELPTALALGTPVIVGDSAFAEEWNGGENGPAVVETDGSTDQIAEALIELLTRADVTERLRLAGRERVIARGEAARVIAGLLDQSLEQGGR